MLFTWGNAAYRLFFVTQMLPREIPMSKSLTVAALEKFKPGGARREIPDGLLTGLYFIVQPTGRKSWAIRYRSGGRPRKMSLGPYPALGLSEAREQARMALQKVQLGDDPALAKQNAKRAAKKSEFATVTTFEGVVRLFLIRHAKPNNRSWRETARQLGLAPNKSKADCMDDPKAFVVVDGGITDNWGYRQISDITRAEVITILDEIVDRGAPVMANRTLAALRKLFNWSIERDLVKENPCDRIKPPTVERSRDRILSDEEIRAFWKAASTMGWPFGELFKILLLTGQRRDEVGRMSWTEINGELWTIPRVRVKNDKAHDVPLNAAAVEVLEALPRITNSDLVFTTNGVNSVSGFSKAKATIDRHMQTVLSDGAADGKTTAIEPWRLHDLRRTVASGMAKLGISLAVIEKILNHTSGSLGGIAGVYQRYDFADEKRRALVAWGNHISYLVDRDEAKHVVTLANLTSR